MMQKNNEYLVKDLENNKVTVWNLNQILEEINRDRSENWQPYNKKDWLEGWNEWVEGIGYTILCSYIDNLRKRG